MPKKDGLVCDICLPRHAGVTQTPATTSREQAMTSGKISSPGEDIWYPAEGISFSSQGMPSPIKGSTGAVSLKTGSDVHCNLPACHTIPNKLPKVGGLVSKTKHPLRNVVVFLSYSGIGLRIRDAREVPVARMSSPTFEASPFRLYSAVSRWMKSHIDCHGNLGSIQGLHVSKNLP
ncbi:hypothetical protein PVAR5_1539 [Paecilomyces variotii No. 5]|uniref:Uncharacterized protein n=1 Tax=Byssochlamys spectabilis (strain No. 5 / NBRC 109023) TaxID=1356009 RepID=V5HTS4_BYSSN|nr:hypothetical protein PVAR5_1539 [Paecilomyces variotii No. 5]